MQIRQQSLILVANSAAMTTQALVDHVRRLAESMVINKTASGAVRTADMAITA